MRYLVKKYQNLSDVTKRVLYMGVLCALLFTAILYLCIGIYQDTVSDDLHCLWISEFLMVIWFFVFPSSMQKKEIFLLHMAFFLFEILFYGYMIIYWITYINTSNVTWDIIFAILLPILMVHTFYVLFKVWSALCKLFESFNQNENRIIVIVKKITSVLVVITAFITQIVTVLELIPKLL